VPQRADSEEAALLSPHNPVEHTCWYAGKALDPAPQAVTSHELLRPGCKSPSLVQIPNISTQQPACGGAAIACCSGQCGTRSVALVDKL
jgi:hypothetical protein